MRLQRLRHLISGSLVIGSLAKGCDSILDRHGIKLEEHEVLFIGILALESLSNVLG